MAATDGTYPAGSSVTVVAIPNDGYGFVQWTDGAAAVSAAEIYTFTAAADRTLVANFAAGAYSITTSASPSGGGSTTGDGFYPSGSTVTVTATPNAGYASGVPHRGA